MERYRKAIPAWYKWKYEAEKVLVKRTSFEWIILRPGVLNDNPGTGKAAIGRTGHTESISVSFHVPHQKTMWPLGLTPLGLLVLHCVHQASDGSPC